MGIKLYNKVPDSVKKLDNFKIFKKELKSLLLSHFFYSVDRFLQFSLKLIYKVFLQRHHINIMISHYSTVLYWTVYCSNCFITPYR